MVADITQFNAAGEKQKSDYTTARGALVGRRDLMRAEKMEIDALVDQLSLIAQAVERQVGSGNTGTVGNTGGGTTNPPPSSSAALALVKSAMLAAPTTYAAVPAASTITVLQGQAGELPVYPGGVTAVLHYFAPPANSNLSAPAGFPDILTVAKMAAPETFTPAFWGESRWRQNNGDNTIQRQWAQEVGSHVAGFTINGRYFSYEARYGGRKAAIMVNGVLQPTITVDGDDRWTTIDLGSRGTRNIVFSGGGNEFGGIAIPAGDTIAPFDFMAGKIRYNTLRDSWGQRIDYQGRNLRSPDIYALLIGAHSVGGYVKGGTGYLENVSDSDDDQRRLDMKAGNPHLIDLRMMVNDNDPQQNANLQPRVRKVFEYVKADSPNAVFQVVAQTSQGSRSTVVGGETRKRDLYLAEWYRIPGPKIFLDGLEGTFYCDNGTGSGVKTRATKLGPVITGEGSEEAPANDGGNADWAIDNPNGRHATSRGTVYIEEFFARLQREALAMM